MGAFYSNILIRGADGEAVADWLRGRGRQAFILPEPNGMTAVFDKECENRPAAEIKKLAGDLSRELNCIAWTVSNHDSDLLTYLLFDKGELVDRYSSISEAVYFGVAEGDVDEDDDLGEEDESSYAPVGGNARMLCQLMGGTDIEDVVKILADPGPMGGTFMAADERHYALLEALNLDPVPLCIGYKYLSQGGGSGDLIHIP